MNTLVDDLTELEYAFVLGMECEVDHDEIAEMTNLALPVCGIEVGAELRDCNDRYYICLPLANFIQEHGREPGVTCRKHGTDCMELVWW